MPVRHSDLTRITLRGGCGLQLREIVRVEHDRGTVSDLLCACDAMDRVRRAGSIEVDAAAERLLPRGRLDLALGAVGSNGALAGIANANVIANGTEAFEIAILVAPAWRGRGLGSTLLRAAAQLLPRTATASGVVGRDNALALSLLGHLAPTARLTLDSDSVTFRIAVGDVLVPQRTPGVRATPHSAVIEEPA
jgi:GNAT superfamily N-acetyltransferase